MEREIISTRAAPAAVGPYSQGVRSGSLIFTAGQIGLDPETGQMAGADLETQTRQVMRNLSAVLEAAGSGLERVIKTTIFLTDMGEFATVNRIYGEFFSETPPARSTVEVSALPLGALVEIEMVAVL